MHIMILLVVLLEPGNQIMTMAFNVDGYNYATCGSDKSIRIYRTANHKVMRMTGVL
jgi:hypothetical protein